MVLFDLLLKRRSVRNFTGDSVPEEIITQLLEAANNAPTGGNIQPLSIIVVQEAGNRQTLAELVGEQPWVRNAPLSMIFCLDFQRVKRWAALNGTEFKGEQALNHFLIAYADLMCAAQTVVILAENLGLGSVYIGTVQSSINETREAFDIPQYVLPMMVLTLGYPKSIPKSIPKLNYKIITHRERYHTASDEVLLDAYEAKYGEFNSRAESYLEKAFIETVEADKQGGDGWVAWAMEEMKKLEIKNNADFLFRLRYPADRMVQLNEHLIDSFKNAGFDIFVHEGD